jgi:hypothetical protein
MITGVSTTSVNDIASGCVAVCSNPLEFSSNLRRLFSAEIVPTTGKLDPMIELVRQVSWIVVMVLMDDTAAVVSVWYSEGRLMYGTHMPGLVVTK